MLNVDQTLPKDPDEMRQFTALFLAEVKAQAVLIEKLCYQLAGQPLPSRRFAKQICREGRPIERGRPGAGVNKLAAYHVRTNR